MPYKIEDLVVDNNNFTNIKTKTKTELPVSDKTVDDLVSCPIDKSVKNSPKQVTKAKTCSGDWVCKTKEGVIILFWVLLGVVATSLVIRGIQFLFSL